MGEYDPNEAEENAVNSNSREESSDETSSEEDRSFEDDLATEKKEDEVISMAEEEALETIDIVGEATIEEDARQP